MLRTIITGTGRCGTKWASEILRSVNIKCGHESVFNVSGFRRSLISEYDADSSWMAAPFIDSLGDKGIDVIHLLREPISTIRSFMAYPDLFGGPLMAGRYGREHCDELKRAKSELERCVIWYVAWNEKIEKCVPHTQRVKVEDGQESLLRVASIDERPEKEIGVMNHSGKTDGVKLSWDDIPRKYKARLCSMSVRYGYGAEGKV